VAAGGNENDTLRSAGLIMGDRRRPLEEAGDANRTDLDSPAAATAVALGGWLLGVEPRDTVRTCTMGDEGDEGDPGSLHGDPGGGGSRMPSFMCRTAAAWASVTAGAGRATLVRVAAAAGGGGSEGGGVGGGMGRTDGARGRTR